MTSIRYIKSQLRGVIEESDSDEVATLAQEALSATDEVSDPYTLRVERFHRAVREHGDADYLTVLAEAFDEDDLPVPDTASAGVEDMMAEVIAERNRLFWAAFLSEETGEVASCLTSGEQPSDFEEEVADVLILTHAIADVFGFDMMAAFHRKMDENDRKPKRQEGTGKLPTEAREQWRGDGE
jgi:NTP pyrophosphatase (non-canonical NTP hydrolase)